MNNIYINNYPTINLYEKALSRSKIVTQMIYGESFSVLNRTKKWLKIKIKEDNYIGYIENKNFSKFLKPTHKISILKARIFKEPNNRKKLGELSFGSKIKITNRYKNFVKFNKFWIKSKNVKPIKFTYKNLFHGIKKFKGVKYKWGCKTFEGIDCSALVQVFLNFNNRYCPRDTKQQIKYFLKTKTLKNIKKNDLLYWKGHVAIALSKKKLIHAYGPMKKTVISDINITIKKIKKTANLQLLSIKKII